MAVNFGRLGTVTFGRNANIVCTPESQITVPAAPAEPTWTLSFNDIYNITNGMGQTNTQTIPETATLYFDLADENWYFGDCYIYKNNIEVFGGTVDTTISFNANDTLYIAAESPNINTSMTIRQNNASGRVITTFNITVFGGG